MIAQPTEEERQEELLETLCRVYFQFYSNRPERVKWLAQLIALKGETGWE